MKTRNHTTWEFLQGWLDQPLSSAPLSVKLCRETSVESDRSLLELSEDLDRIASVLNGHSHTIKSEDRL